METLLENIGIRSVAAIIGGFIVAINIWGAKFFFRGLKSEITDEAKTIIAHQLAELKLEMKEQRQEFIASNKELWKAVDALREISGRSEQHLARIAGRLEATGTKIK